MPVLFPYLNHFFFVRLKSGCAIKRILSNVIIWSSPTIEQRDTHTHAMKNRNLHKAILHNTEHSHSNSSKKKTEWKKM